LPRARPPRFSLHPALALPDLPSFPTRRSSDLKHPTWSMGAKITIDSATLMNKGLELIEAHHLFGLPAAKLEVVVHPQSIVHALVDRKSTRLNSSHVKISYAVFCLEKKKTARPR